MTDLRQRAEQALAALDLTDLSDTCTDDDVIDLVARAKTPHGPVAAVCVWPRFVTTARRAIGKAPIKVATVVNFPSGMEPASEVIAATEAAIADGADEIDVVVPWPALLEGHPENVPARVSRVKRASDGRPVKAIIESGMLDKPELIRDAAMGAIDGGADFVKTSTGKVPVNATPEAARIILEAIRESGDDVGFKAAGGVKSTEDAAVYLALAEEIMGEGWATPDRFRFGASGVLGALLATLEGRGSAAVSAGY